MSVVLEPKERERLINQDILMAEAKMYRLWKLFLVVINPKTLAFLVQRDTETIQRKIEEGIKRIHRQKLDRMSNEQLQQLARKEARRLRLMRKHFPEAVNPEPLEIAAERRRLMYAGQAVSYKVLDAEGIVVGVDYRNKSNVERQLLTHIRRSSNGRSTAEMRAQCPEYSKNQIDHLLNGLAERGHLRKLNGGHGRHDIRWVAVEKKYGG